MVNQSLEMTVGFKKWVQFFEKSGNIQEIFGLTWRISGTVQSHVIREVKFLLFFYWSC